MPNYTTSPMVTTEQIKMTAHCIAEVLNDEHLIVDMTIEMMTHPFRDVMEEKYNEAMRIHHESLNNYEANHEPF